MRGNLILGEREKKGNAEKESRVIRKARKEQETMDGVKEPGKEKMSNRTLSIEMENLQSKSVNVFVRNQQPKGEKLIFRLEQFTIGDRKR